MDEINNTMLTLSYNYDLTEDENWFRWKEFKNVIDCFMNFLNDYHYDVKASYFNDDYEYMILVKGEFPNFLIPVAIYNYVKNNRTEIKRHYPFFG